MNGTTAPTYLDRLMAELEQISDDYRTVLDRSALVPRNLPPNVIGFTSHRWADSNDALEHARMELLGRVRSWEPRFRLLFPHPTNGVGKRLDKHLGHMKSWLVRKNERNVPSSMAEAVSVIENAVADLRALASVLPPDKYAARLVVDTNTLIDNPDLAVYTPTIGNTYMVHVLPVVLRELDELKRAGRNPELREAAKRADRRLKALRENGDVRSGARVAGNVYAVFEHIEPQADGLPSWIDLTVPDDRLVASSLLVQSAHPGSALYVSTSDLNLQTKLAAVGLPVVETPGAV
jgi:rRNA-processing protein FCF1